MKKLLLALPLLLCACVTQPVNRVTLPGVDHSGSVPVSDFRPANEKASEIFSLLISSSAYGIYRKGDETLDPPMTSIFRRRVYEKFGANGQPLSISIHHMVVYLNAKSALRKGAIGAGLGGVIGSVIASSAANNLGVNLSQSKVNRAAFEALADREHERSFYTEAENPEKATVFVIYIDAEVNGRRAFIKTLAPSTAPEGQDPYFLAVDSSIQYYLSQI